MDKYVTSQWGRNPIKKIEVERETDKCVWIKGSKQLKRSSYENIFTSWDEAHEFLIEKAARKVEAAQRHLKGYTNDLDKIKALKKSDCGVS